MSPYITTPLPRTAAQRRRHIRPKQKHEKYVKAPQLRRLLRELKKNPANRRNQRRDYMLMVLMINCGLRVGEVCIVSRRDCGRLRDRIPFLEVAALKKRAPKGETPEKDLPPEEKTRKTVYVHPRVAEVILEYLAGMAPRQQFFFEGGDNEHMSTRQVRSVFYTYCRQCGFTEAYSTHALRHAYGALCWKATKDMKFVGDQLGHEQTDPNAGATNAYVHIDDQDIAAMVLRVKYFL
jgi:integrase